MTTMAGPRPLGRRTPDAIAAAEKTLLGAMIQSIAATETAAEMLTGADFADANRALVFEAAVSLAGDGGPVDPAAVLARMGKLMPERSKMAPDGLLLAGLMEDACAAPMAEYHADAIRTASRLTRLGEVAIRLAQRAETPGADPEDIIDAVRQELDALLGSSRGDEHVATAAQLFDRVVDDLDRPQTQVSAIPTGLADLDAMLHGLHDGQFVVIGARPGSGKSTLALDFARHAAIRLGYPVVFASVEMDHEELMHRLIAAEARVSLEAMKCNQLAERDWNRIAGIRERVQSSVLLIDDSPDTGLARIRARLRRMATTSPARLLIVDYLQLLKTITTENRQQAVADLTRNLKLLAREFSLPVVVCAQLNRAPEQRSDKRPVKSDLRECGAIEADADVILLLHREEQHDPAKRPGEMDVIIDKNRRGREGVVPVAFFGDYGCCLDLAKPSWSPSAKAVD